MVKVEFIKKGISNPQKIPPYILGKLFPKSRWGEIGDNVEIRQEYIHFNQGSFAASPNNLSEFTSKLYHEVSNIHHIVEEHVDNAPSKSLEIGCGYGRLSPWIADLSEQHIAIDPNKESIEKAREQYPHIQFQNELAQELPFKENTFDLLVAWTVLQHIPPNKIQSATDEIQRVTKNDGLLIVTENTKEDNNGPTAWGRSEGEYEELLGKRVVESHPKPVERTFTDYKGEIRTSHPFDMVMVMK
jgi:SAM-dependent methyltransferase